MTDDLLRELSRLRQRAAGLTELINTAQSAAPKTVTATDRSGTVHVTLGPDGLPEKFRVDQYWQRHVQPEKLGGVILEAFESAMSQRLATWARTLEDEGWQTRFNRLRAAAPPDGHVPPALARPRPSVAPRSLDALAEDMIRAVGGALGVAEATPRAARGTGIDRSGKLTLTVSASGLVSCVVKTRWAARQTGTVLTNALTQALAAAKSDLARNHGGPASGADLNGLAGEAMTLLNDPKRM